MTALGKRGFDFCQQFRGIVPVRKLSRLGEQLEGEFLSLDEFSNGFLTGKDFCTAGRCRSQCRCQPLFAAQGAGAGKVLIEGSRAKEMEVGGLGMVLGLQGSAIIGKALPVTVKPVEEILDHLKVAGVILQAGLEAAVTADQQAEGCQQQTAGNGTGGMAVVTGGKGKNQQDKRDGAKRRKAAALMG